MRVGFECFVPVALVLHFAESAEVVDGGLSVEHDVFVWSLLLLEYLDGSEYVGNGLLVGQ